MTVLSVKLFTRQNCLPRKAGRDIYTWHLGGPPSRQHGVQTGWPWKGWWSTMHFRTAEWEEKLLAWHPTTVSMNKTRSTFETKPFKSESMHLCTKTQDHRPAALLAIKQEAFKSSSFYWDSSLRRNKALFLLQAYRSTVGPATHKGCGYWSPSCPICTWVWRKGLPTGAEYKWQAPFQVPTGGEFWGDWENDCPSPNWGEILQKDLV